jgi:exoribonuclease R
MPLPRVWWVTDAAALAEGLDRIRAELAVPAGFPPDVEAAAEAAASAPPEGGSSRTDRTDLELVTLDPPGARDLDQAFALERRAGADGGWRVWYAIADVAAFVAAGEPVDAEAWRRGVTLYLPDGRAPLHPPVLSEGAASLLPGGDRPAVLWRLDVDSAGSLVDTSVERAVVRSRGQLDYPTVEAAAPDTFAVLREVGTALEAAEVDRGGVSLPLPDQIVERRPDGRSRLAWRTPLPVEGWNAQLSLRCGRAAAALMLDAGVGLLRTLPPPDERVLDRLRRAAAALGVRWPDDGYPAFVRALDPATPPGAALLNQAARGLRGAGYAAFGPGVAPVPVGDDARHAAVAAPYAHVTAPLRRLADRYATESVVSGAEWAVAGLAALPAAMGAARQKEGAVSRAVVDLAEALVLADRRDLTLDAVVVGTDPERGSDLQLLDPPVRARVAEPLALGAEVRVRVESADPAARHIQLGTVVGGTRR